MLNLTRTIGNDAEGVAEASMRPHMKFVPVKQIEQQDALLIYCARELVIKQIICFQQNSKGKAHI